MMYYLEDLAEFDKVIYIILTPLIAICIMYGTSVAKGDLITKMVEDLLEVRMILDSPDSDSDHMIVPMKCNGVILNIRLDTGVERTVFGEKDWNKIKENSDAELRSSKICLVPYGNIDNPIKLPVKGTANVTMTAKDALELGYIAVHKTRAKEAVNKDDLQQETVIKNAPQQEDDEKDTIQNEAEPDDTYELSIDDEGIRRIVKEFEKNGGRDWENFATGLGFKLEDKVRNKIRVRQGEVDRVDRKFESVEGKLVAVMSVFEARCKANGVDLKSRCKANGVDLKLLDHFGDTLKSESVFGNLRYADLPRQIQRKKK